MKKLLAAVLFLSACAAPKMPRDSRMIDGVDKEFLPYIQLYLSYKGRPLNYSIAMGFADLSDYTVGECMIFSGGHRQIRVDRQYWKDMLYANEYRISLIAHELGHCDLNRGHSHDPSSIMYEYNNGSTNFYELFHPNGQDFKTNKCQ